MDGDGSSRFIYVMAWEWIQSERENGGGKPIVDSSPAFTPDPPFILSLNGGSKIKLDLPTPDMIAYPRGIKEPISLNIRCDI